MEQTDRSKKWMRVAGAIILIAIIFGISSHSKTTKKNLAENSRVVRIGYLPVVHALPLYVAINRNYFEDAGVKVEVTKFEAPNQIIDALLSGNIDISMAGATGITAVAESKKPNSLRVFAIAGGDSTHIADAFIVASTSPIKSIAELKGKKVGILPGIQWKTIARNLFTKNGIDIDKDLTLVEIAVPLQTQSLASGQIDALLTVEPVISIAKAHDISRILVESPNLTYISNPFYAGVGNVSVAFMTEYPDLFKKVLGILDRSTREINTNSDTYRNDLVGFTPADATLAKIIHLPIYKMYTDMNDADFTAVQKFIDIFQTYKVIETPVNARTLVYHD